MNRIKEFRKKKNLSQCDIAKLLNVKQSTIANWEREHRNPSVKQAIELAKILDVRVEDLYK